MRIDVDYLEDELGIKVEHHRVIDSTMNYVGSLISNKKTSPEIVVADYQTDGVGRIGRKFYSPDSTGLYLTLVFNDTCFTEGDITPRIALSVRDAIYSVLKVSCSIKWVNDLYCNNKKVCGILCRRMEGYFSAGIGINVEEPKIIPEELIGVFGFLTKQCDCNTYTHLVKEIYTNCLVWSKRNKKDVLTEYRKYCNHIGKEVLVYQNEKALCGKCIDISDDFSILVEINGKLTAFSSGEMSLKI